MRGFSRVSGIAAAAALFACAPYVAAAEPYCDIFAAGNIPRSYRAQSKVSFYKTADIKDNSPQAAYIIAGDYFLMAKQKDGSRCAAYLPDGKIKAAGFIREAGAGEKDDKDFDDAKAAAFFRDSDAEVRARDSSNADYVETGRSEYSALFAGWGGFDKSVGYMFGFYNIGGDIVGIFIWERGCVGDDDCQWSTIGTETGIILKVSDKSYAAVNMYGENAPQLWHYIVLDGKKVTVDGGGSLTDGGGGTYSLSR